MQICFDPQQFDAGRRDIPLGSLATSWSRPIRSMPRSRIGCSKVTRRDRAPERGEAEPDRGADHDWNERGTIQERKQAFWGDQSVSAIWVERKPDTKGLSVTGGR